MEVKWLVEGGLIPAFQPGQVLDGIIGTQNLVSVKDEGTYEEIIDGEQQALRRCMRMAQVLSCLGIQRAIHCELEVAVIEG